MKFNRIRFSKEASESLNKMKGRMGLTWNVLSRIGFCISLNDLTEPNPADYKADGDIEIDRKILTGHEDELYVALLKQRCINSGIAEDEYLDYFKAHMNRGAILLSKRIGSIKDLAQLITA
ncbi:MAG: DNA sulfur modification protein DndE [Sphingobacteriales bacterium]|nr:MAG: DNA sulfur modification protein DndE [Sphingobacteriales bacterium]